MHNLQEFWETKTTHVNVNLKRNMKYTDLKQNVKTQCTKFQREFGHNEKSGKKLEENWTMYNLQENLQEFLESWDKCTN